MARSQIQCLDDHHVNWRVSESKPEFFYSENQRLAIEELINKGREAFTDYVRENDVREFLSDPELEWIAHTAEAYRPGHEHHQKPDTPLTPGPGNITPGSGEEAGDGEVSLQYWPDRSEASVVELDLGWPEAISYRGVTRVTVYTQPPTDGHTHIKEVVRKSIAGAQKVIAVVMDVFTDVDIFRDLLDAAYKRKVPVYIIIDMAAVPCFLSMCGRADMHRGHLKNLRVRCCGGVEFFTRSAQKVRGVLSQKFLLVDGDRAISGSYSFTWSSSRLDRNLITVITGQAVETFDLQFRDLYLTSRGVSLNKVPMVDEPIPDPVPQAAPAPVSAAIARKLINPKYALVTAGASNPALSDQNSKTSNSQNPLGLKTTKGRLKHVMEEPALHPGLAYLEKANLIPYLPTWPEPDPPSDVIGFINIRDEKRANQVHLQRSERFEVSQAIRFRSPLIQAPASNTAETDNPSGNTSPGPSTPVSATSKQTEEKTNKALNIDQTDSSRADLQPQSQDTHVKIEDIPKSLPTATADSQPKEKQPPGTQAPAPPVPKRRTLQLVIDSAPLEQPGQPQVTLMKMDQPQSPDESSGIDRKQEELALRRLRLTSRDIGGDSGSNDEGSQDSTKVICDRAANDDPSSTSTVSEEEFYDTQQDPSDMLTNGVTTGSGRGNRHADGVNMMARLSQSMLDLREPNQSEDSLALLRQSRELRRQPHASPHRHIGQLFKMSRSPQRDARLQGNKQENYQRPKQAVGPVIVGHRYWPDSAQLRSDTRSGRSPQRYNQDSGKMDHGLTQPPTNPTGLLGVSLSKLNSFRHLRARGGVAQKKVSQNNKAAR
ncbi:hypothetical protein JOB18_010117 [Solea senegalensis]|uniref:Scaffolding anchor of CK1 domain-containing protein n=2 Tax=Solea senegalensis TaxID=28829 RepID=A0AAV6Q5U6_SOLSE|nr:protein FAM83G [Solea senegalensis]KAG7485432.1 hypothetical protein JOB18_010117 [Solea senegalensis]